MESMFFRKRCVGLYALHGGVPYGERGGLHNFARDGKTIAKYVNNAQ